jgi:hypothetical protein
MGRSTVLALAVVGAFLSYTTEGQQKYRLIWRRWLLHRDLPTGGVIVEERNHLDGFGGYEKSLTDGSSGWARTRAKATRPVTSTR